MFPVNSPALLLEAFLNPIAPFLLEDSSGLGSLDSLQYGLVITVGVVLVGAFLVLHLMRRRAPLPHRSTDPGPSRPRRGDPEVERLRVDLESLAHEVEGRLNTKMVCLRRLIAEADEAAKRLEALRDDGPEALVAERTSNEGDPECHHDRPGHDRPGHDRTGHDRTGHGRRGDETENRAAATVDASGSKESDAERARIVELFTAGRQAEEIAEEVGLPKGEVELVINLFQTERSC